MRLPWRRASMLGVAVALAVLLATVACSSPSEDDTATPGWAEAQIAGADVVVDVTDVVVPVNRNLQGLHSNLGGDDLAAARNGVDDRVFRRVVNAGDGYHWSCAEHRIGPGQRSEIDGWLDGAFALGGTPVLALAYVPQCVARGGNPKAPPVDAAGYRDFLTTFLDSVVSARIEVGKPPLQYLEVWNEPDGPVAAAENPAHGHGFDGTIDEFVSQVFLPLGRAVDQEEQRSGANLRLGVAASFNGIALGELAADATTFLTDVVGLAPDQAEQLAPLAEVLIGSQFGGASGLRRAGGFAWSDRLIGEAEGHGIDVEFVSWHHYANNPLSGYHAPPDPDTPAELAAAQALLAGRNPLASARNYLDQGRAWRDRYPGRELLLGEWGLAPSFDARVGTFDDAAFHAAVMIALQQSGIDLVSQGPVEGIAATVHRWFDDLGDDVLDQDRPTRVVDDQAVWLLPTAEGPGHVRLLAAQWHPRAEDAGRLDVTVALTGLADGTYRVSTMRVDRGHEGTVPEPSTVDAREGVATVTIPLHGQAGALVRVDRTSRP